MTRKELQAISAEFNAGLISFWEARQEIDMPKANKR